MLPLFKYVLRHGKALRYRCSNFSNERVSEKQQTMLPDNAGFAERAWCATKTKGTKLCQRIANPPPVVSVIRLSGVIGAAGRGKAGLTLHEYQDIIKSAFEQSRTKAVVLAINSPGGSPVQSDLIARYIRQQAEQKQLPVYAFVEDVAASGGYWLACAADEIYAMGSSIVGSIGVISAGFGFTDAIDRLGIERRVHTAGKNKSILDPFQPEKAEDVKLIEAIQKDIHEQFKNYVKERRGERLKSKNAAIFSGEFWTGTKGESLGLVDGIGDLYSVMRAQYGEKMQFKQFDKPKGKLQKLMGLGAQRSGLADEVIDAVEARATYAKYGL